MEGMFLYDEKYISKSEDRKLSVNFEHLYVCMYQCTKLPGGHLSQLGHVKDSEILIKQ